MVFSAPKSFFRVLSLVERAAAYAQGKGYGAATTAREIDLLLGLLTHPPRLAIDIGGNIGHYAAELRRRKPELEIHVFEPSAENIARLTARFELDGLIKLVPCAVSDDVGSATLFSDKAGSGLGSLTKRRLDHFNIAFDVAETVNTIRFEDYWRDQLQSRQIDLAKIDVEGHELAVLKGFGNALNATAIFQFEFGGCNIDTRTYFQDFWYLFEQHQFALYRITPLGAERVAQYRESDEFFSTTNYLAVNPRFAGS
jgi:FkbM family methyltransferase